MIPGVTKPFNAMGYEGVHVQTKVKEYMYLWKYKSSVLQTWHQKCSSQKKPNNTHSIVVIETLSAPVSFRQNQISSFSTI